jgi:CheY-like chemotaxis protein
MRSVELEDVVKAAIATVQPAADAKGVALELSIAASMPTIWADPDRLQQVVWNLLSNAVKFTPPGGHVQLRLERDRKAVTIVVSDDGRGIEPAFLPHIFERFRQADSRFSREHGGLGLGLAIVRELIELHGGTVSATSAGPGKGATFEIRLPRAAAHGDAREDRHGGAMSAAPALVRPAARLHGVRVLAVDDEEDALGLLRVILESAGAQVATASSAERALELLASGRFDCLIADIGMPRVDGLELIRRVRQTLPSPANRIPAAALTAYARSEDRVTALASGFEIHIAKPVNPAALITAVSSLVNK